MSLTTGTLYKFAGGLNIEGGHPQFHLSKCNPTKRPKWINLVLVLDRPLIDHIVFDDLFANNRFRYSKTRSMRSMNIIS